MEQRSFYKNLIPLTLKARGVFENGLFVPMPKSWHVIIMDIKNSTIAVNEGRHNDVNLVAASSLIIGLNIAREEDLEIPFFFTGDGGTLIVPEHIQARILNALANHNENSIKNFNLELHYGSVSIADILSAGHQIEIAKLFNGKGFPKPIVIGSGLQYAEVMVKKSRNEADNNNQVLPANIEGLECRWDRVNPPLQENEIVCYLIEVNKPEEQIQIYSRVLQKMDELYGDPDTRHPLSLPRLKLLLSVNKIGKEMLARFGRWKNDYIIFEFLKTFIASLCFKFNLRISNIKGVDYLKQVISNADTLTIDGRISTIITGTREKRLAFINYLEDEERNARLIFGHYINKASIMTCYIENRDNRHIHFVDGADGGYTAASKELKQKVLLRRNGVSKQTPPEL